MRQVYSSGEDAQETNGDEWLDLLEIPGTSVVDHVTLINEGDFPGFWRLKKGDEATAPARLPAGGGEVGERRSAVQIPCPGFSGGVLQVKRGFMGGSLTGLFAFAMQIR